jgi:hypothetical protein
MTGLSGRYWAAKPHATAGSAMLDDVHELLSLLLTDVQPPARPRQEFVVENFSSAINSLC